MVEHTPQQGIRDMALQLLHTLGSLVLKLKAELLISMQQFNVINLYAERLMDQLPREGTTTTLSINMDIILNLIFPYHAD